MWLSIVYQIQRSVLSFSRPRQLYAIIFTHFVRMNVTGFGPLNWIAGKSVTNVIQENVLQVNNAYLSKKLKLEGSREYEVL